MAARMVMGKTEERNGGRGASRKKKATAVGFGEGGPLAAWGYNAGLPVATAGGRREAAKGGIAAA